MTNQCLTWHFHFLEREFLTCHMCLEPGTETPEYHVGLCLGDHFTDAERAGWVWCFFFFSEPVNGLPHLCVHRQVN